MKTQAPTKTLKKDYCLGIDAIKGYGIERWKDEFFLPFSVKDYNEVLNAMYEAFKKVLHSDIAQESKDVMCIMFKVMPKCGHLLHKHLVEKYLKVHGYNIIATESDRYQDLLGKIPQPARKTKIKYGLLNLKNSIRYIGQPKETLNIGSSGRIKDLYAKNHRSSLYYKPLNELLHMQDSIPESFRKDIEYIRDSFHKAASGILNYFSKEYNIEYDADMLKTLADDVAKDLHLAMRIYLGTKEKIAGLRFTHVLASGTGSPFKRIILKALQNNGSKIIGAGHGNTTGVFHDRLFLMSGLLPVNTYVVSNGGMKDFFDGLLDKYSDLPGTEGITVESIEDDYFKRTWRRESKKPITRKAKRVMFLEPSLFPYLPLFHGSLYHTAQLDLSLRAMEALKRNGYYTMMKLRSDRLKESDNGRIYKSAADELIGGRFEDVGVYEKADTYIFPHLFTTAFGFSLATNKRLIYFLYEKEKYVQESLRLLHKRCTPVNCWFDERNRIMFDEKELINALEEDVTEINTEFLERYMFA